VDLANDDIRKRLPPNQSWKAKVYEAQARVSYNGKNYLAKWYASTQDIPGNGGPWEEYQEIN
jgi:hypothetical protein